MSVDRRHFIGFSAAFAAAPLATACDEAIRALNSPIDMLPLNAGYRGDA